MIDEERLKRGFIDWDTELLGPHPPDGFVGDGCTAVIEKPEWVEACRWHDWSYVLIRRAIVAGAPKHIAKGMRRVADARFRANLKTLGGPARQYWLGVRLAGWIPLRRRLPAPGESDDF